MSTVARDDACGELYVICPRGHEVHVAFTDRPISAGDLLDVDELAAVSAFAWHKRDGHEVEVTRASLDVAAGELSAARCPSCSLALHSQSIQGRAL